MLLLFLVGLGQTANSDAAANNILLTMGIRLRIGSLLRSDSGRALIFLVHLVLKEPAALLIARDFCRARVLAFEKRYFVLQRDMAKLDCRFAADALTSQRVQRELERLLHALLARGRIEDLAVDLLLYDLLEVLLCMIPVINCLFHAFYCVRRERLFTAGLLAARGEFALGPLMVEQNFALETAVHGLGPLVN